MPRGIGDGQEMVSFTPTHMHTTRRRHSSAMISFSASGVNAEDKRIGRVTVNAGMDFIREQAESEALNLAGCGRRGIVRAVWKSLKNRWTWLASI